MADSLSSLSGATLEKAQRELNEDPDKRLEAITQLRDSIEQWTPSVDDQYEQNLIFARKEDEFLLRFLRAKKFDVDRSLQLYVNYYKYRCKYAHILGEMSVSSARGMLTEGGLCVLPPRNGPRVIIIRVQCFDFDNIVPGDLLKSLLLVFDRILDIDEEAQVHGFVVVEDLSGFSLMTAMHIAGQEAVRKGVIVELMQESFPARFKGMHLVAQPWYFSVVFTVIRPFLKQKLRDRFQLHGTDYESLHEVIPPECLPEEYGGSLSAVEEYAAIKIFPTEQN